MSGGHISLSGNQENANENHLSLNRSSRFLLLNTSRINDMASTDVRLPANIGFVGLGKMGLPMFSNLVRNLPQTSTVHFYDVMPEAMEKALVVPGAVAKVDQCKSSREVAEKSVCATFQQS